MIATILPGSADFHAVGYNERKVAKGVAQLIEMKNFGALDRKGRHTPEELVEYLQAYSDRNSRIKKAQFHVAISCKGHEMTEEQLLDFAHQYIKEMGYMEERQPMLVYAHHDTDNMHLHIVTSRVDPNGRKIAQDQERRRSHVSFLLNCPNKNLKPNKNPMKFNTQNFIGFFKIEQNTFISSRLRKSWRSLPFSSP